MQFAAISNPLVILYRVALSHPSDAHQLQPTRLCLKAHTFHSHIRLLFEAEESDQRALVAVGNGGNQWEWEEWKWEREDKDEGEAEKGHHH